MPQDGMNYEGRRKGAHHNSCVVNSQVSGTDLGNGAVVYNGFPAAPGRYSQRRPNGSENCTRPEFGVNGYINFEYRGKSRKAVPARTFRKQENMLDAVTDAAASGRVVSAGIKGGTSVNGDAVSDQMTPELSFPAKARNQKRKKRFSYKKRDTKVNGPGTPTPPPMVPQEKEDWEKEIQEVTLADWEKICFGMCPYGPEDLLHFSLRDLTLKQRDSVPLPLTANYRPAIHHPHPIKWSCFSVSTEPDQFSDADE
ncbi:uncharacterized protein LOC121508075 [Cheilinus undulatus]|uniref:uncharacterized protein LOC121508075 n=1 Tax=Cheilinus undulatus TaxID=241271 RepID=UPI001BD2D7DC|nr:uncharacterized protein LOC121508075 [Cheilinus undulatus]